ncbi:YcnI family protein [Streptomyces sp. NPDC005438]|uniref:YcnI family copper-binding membrane protein n=1 Tax=Streptomyces sp. NPDC005438 TaxID=3156880 RepID=UPI0033A84888
MHQSVRRLLVLGGVTVTALTLGTGPALAHVSVPETAERGGYGTVNFKVPNERDNASTVKVEVFLPKEHPLASVMPQPVPGWKVKVTQSKLDKPLESHGRKITEAASRIVWSGGEIKPGQFQQFPVSLGQLPSKGDQLVLKTLQTYDNKEVVRWIEEPKKGEKEPETPAPVLRLTAPEEDGHGGTARQTDSKDSGDSGKGDQDQAAKSSGSDTTARVLGVAGIVIGAAGVAFGALAGRRRGA